MTEKTEEPMSDNRSIREHASQLGIVMARQEMFELLVDLMRAPNTKDAELALLRERLAKVDQVLHEAGFVYPPGAQGVEDMASALAMAIEDREAVRERMQEQIDAIEAIDAALGRMPDLPERGAEGVRLLVERVIRLSERVKATEEQALKYKQQLFGINQILRRLGIEKEDDHGVIRLAVMYEDARDKAAEEDLRRLREDLKRQLKRVNIQRDDTQGLRDLVDKYLALQDMWAQDHRDERMVTTEQATRLEALEAALTAAGVDPDVRGVQELVERRKTLQDSLEWHEGQWQGVDGALAERGYTMRGLSGVKMLAEHDRVLAEDATATNAILEEVGWIKYRGSVGVRALRQLLKESREEVALLAAAVDKEWTDKMDAIHALKLVGKTREQLYTLPKEKLYPIEQDTEEE